MHIVCINLAYNLTQPKVRFGWSFSSEMLVIITATHRVVKCNMYKASRR